METFFDLDDTKKVCFSDKPYKIEEGDFPF